jgi:hypothetical protein
VNKLQVGGTEGRDKMQYTAFHNIAADGDNCSKVHSSFQKSDSIYRNFSHRCGSPQDAVASITMASNVAAVDLMKQPYQVIISRQILELKMKGICSLNSSTDAVI